MLITYDNAADAVYLYFQELRLGQVERTLYDQPLRFDTDLAGQFVSMALSDSEEIQIRSRLKHVSDDESVRFDAEANELVISFTDANSSEAIDWSGNIDLDHDGQVVGIEILFGPAVCAGERLRHVRKFFMGEY